VQLVSLLPKITWKLDLHQIFTRIVITPTATHMLIIIDFEKTCRAGPNIQNQKFKASKYRILEGFRDTGKQNLFT